MWETVQLGDLCEILDTRRKPITKKDRIHGEYPYYGATGIVDWVVDYIFDEELVLIGEDGAKWDAGEKTAFIVDGKYWVNNHAHVVKPNTEKLLNKWLTYYLCGVDLKPWVTGMTVPKLNQGQLKSIPIPLPPLAEQQRIVAKLDAAFAEIDEAIETTNESLKSIQQLFLTSLDTLVNADDLGESIPLGEICELAQGLAINKGTKHLLVGNSSKPLIRIKDLVNETEEQYITDEYENTKTEVNEEDLIFTRTGSLGLVFRGRKGVLHNNSFKVTPNQAISRDYLYWWLKNPSFLDSIHKISGKAAQPDISHKLFKDQQIKVPTAAKQKDIVAKIELLFKQIEKMKKINLHKLNQIHALKSAMLFQELQLSEAA